MLDPTATYRTSQVVSASRAGQIVLLYQGAIRFGAQHLAFIERNDVEQAHKASVRCQEIVTALRGCLDLTAGPIAVQLDQLYDFVLRRLETGNLTKEPRPTEEALQVLRGLLEAWQDLAARPASELVDEPAQPVARRAPVSTPVSAPVSTPTAPTYAGAGLYSMVGARR
jgi:flagellar secretion chaperone FliS